MINALENTVEPVITEADIKGWMVEYLSKLLDLSPDEILEDADFKTMGLDSSSSVGITGDLSNWIGVELDETLLFNYPTINDVSKHVVALL